MNDRKILLLVDPRKKRHHAIESIERVIKDFSHSGELEFVTLITTNLEGVDADVNNINIDEQWIENLLKDLSSHGHKNTVHIAWSNDWAETVLEFTDRYDTNFSIIPFYDRQSNHVLTDQKWKLLRNSHKPVLISKGKQDSFSNIVLAAVKVQDPKYKEANEKVMAGAHRIASLTGSEVHAVNAYEGSMDYPDRAKLIELTGLENERIHVEDGAAKDAICKVAKKINADSIFIASQRRKGISGRLRGNTIEKIVDQAECGLFMI